MICQTFILETCIRKKALELLSHAFHRIDQFFENLIIVWILAFKRIYDVLTQLYYISEVKIALQHLKLFE